MCDSPDCDCDEVFKPQPHYRGCRTTSQGALSSRTFGTYRPRSDRPIRTSSHVPGANWGLTPSRGGLCDSLYLDGAHLNASVVEAILRPYPELWRQWQARVQRPEAHDKLGSDGLRQYHSPTYLTAVIREYDHLREGDDRPDRALAKRCEAIVSSRPEFAEERRRNLNDPWWRADSALTPEIFGYEPIGVGHYYDPAWLQSHVDGLNELDDPFSQRAIEHRLWCERFSFPPDKRKAAGPYN